MTDALSAVERARRLYRGLEMLAEIMRDPKRTGGWEGAERVATAFERQAESAKLLHAQLCAGAFADAAPAGVEALRSEVIQWADALVMKPGGLRNNGQDLVVVEKADKSDPHWKLCDALQRLAGLTVQGVRDWPHEHERESAALSRHPDATSSAPAGEGLRGRAGDEALREALNELRLWADGRKQDSRNAAAEGKVRREEFLAGMSAAYYNAIGRLAAIPLPDAATGAVAAGLENARRILANTDRAGDESTVVAISVLRTLAHAALAAEVPEAATGEKAEGWRPQRAPAHLTEEVACMLWATELFSAPQEADDWADAILTAPIMAGLIRSARRLAWTARTSGGVAGADADLMAACKAVEDALALAPAPTAPEVSS